MNVLTGPTDPKIVWDRYASYHGALAFDVGANGGGVARVLAEGFDKVVAFEPNLDSLTVMCRTAPDNVLPVHLAVSDTDGRITLRRAEEAMKSGEYVTGSTLESSWGTDLGPVVVEALTLDKAADLFGVPDFVKIDTEGHELAVVEGGLEMLVAARPRLLIEIHSGPNAAAIVGLLEQSHHFEIVRHPHYTVDQAEYGDHFWLIGEPNG